MKRYLLFLATSLLLASCSKSDAPGNNNTGNLMRFTASVPVEETGWSRATRGQVIGSTNIADFGAFCFNTGRTPWATAAATALPNKMFDVEVLRTPSTNDWVYNPPVEWEGGDAAMFTFFGYSPRAKGIYQEPDNSQGNNIEVLSTATDPDIPRLSYTTLDYVPMQIDLLVAKPVYDTYPVDRVRMQFTHALSQIRFKAWAVQDFVRVTSIEISNIKHTATLSLDGTITAGADEKTFVLDNINRSLSTDELNPTDLSDGSNAFLLLPQDLTANTTAQITVTYQVGVEEKTSTPYTIIQNWEPNKSYTYLLSLGGNPTEEMVITSVTMTDWVVDSEEDMSTTPPPSLPINPPTADQIVEIDGKWWTKGNLIADGDNKAKVGAQEDYGLYFHFGSLVGWSGGSNGDGTGQGNPVLMQKVQPAGYSGSAVWPAAHYKDGPLNTGYGLPDVDDASQGIGDPCRYYLGDPWRTPTTDEYKALCNNKGDVGVSYTWNDVGGSWVSSGVIGCYLSSNKLFFPVAGIRPNIYSGQLDLAGTGFYLSSSGDTPIGCYVISFSDSDMTSRSRYSNNWGFPVRCVSSTAP